MKLVVFGATGGTGAQFVQQALAQGHEVTAVARDPARVEAHDARLTIMRGDVRDPSAVEAAVRRQDAVVSCIGSVAGEKPVTIYSAGVGAMLEAMRADSVRRIICISANPLEMGEGDLWFDRLILKPVVRAIFGAPYADMARMEAELRSSDRDWTIMRPPRLLRRPATGRYRLAYDRNLPGGRVIARADLAAAMLQLLDDPKALHSAVTVAY